LDLALAAVAETLASEFAELRSSWVVRVLTDCADEFPYDDQHFIEQAARAQLSLLRSLQVRWHTISAEDPLDVSLHDSELADEVELLTCVVLAANESDRPLSQEEIDEALGLTAEAERSQVPHQRFAGQWCAPLVIPPCA